MKLQQWVGVCIFFFWVLVGCSPSQHSHRNVSASPIVPELKGPTLDSGSIPVGKGKRVTLSNGSEIFIQSRSGVPYFKAEGIFTKEAFSSILNRIAKKPQPERIEYLRTEIGKVFDQVKTIRGVELSQVPEVGYFTFEMPYQPELMAPLKSLRFPNQVTLNPILYESNGIGWVRGLSPGREAGMTPRTSVRDLTRGFSGLTALHVPEFLELAQIDIGGGVKVDGSSVNVGVADTGISYQHPNFLSKNLLSKHEARVRIGYMRDFTREGRVYFHPSARFEVTLPEGDSSEDLLIQAQVIPTPKLPYLPSGEDLVDVNDFRIKVSPELKAILTRPGNGARLGFIDESVFQSSEASVDLNGNGSTEDKLFVIFVPGKTPEDDVIFFDGSGTGDFRASPPIGDWNKTGTTIPLFSEVVGFDFHSDTLPSSNAEGKVEVRSVSLVGLDPGNHGTHVSGIIAGRRTIDNDDPNTLARGIAPEATLMVNRACSNNGGCSATSAIVDLAVNAGVDVINLSLGGLSPFNDGYGVQETLINRLTSFYNILFVISAGNAGPGRQTVTAPSTARLALSVGASATPEMIQRQYQWQGFNPTALNTPADQDFLLFFSSRGPSANGGLKPNVIAPGSELSSIQLNSAPGLNGGMDVLWGTSMAAPAVTGAYALLLDAVRKYNLKYPLKPLPTQVSILRSVLEESARPFDLFRFTPSSGEKLQGQYTWIDEGFGMVDLSAAWKKLLEVRNHPVPSSVKLDGNPIELDYQVYVSMKSPSSRSYQGFASGPSKTPRFGAGLYLSFNDQENFYPVSISRRLPESWSATPLAGELTRQLRTTADEFVLKTQIYGSDVAWIKAGVLDQADCFQSDESRLTLLSEGVNITIQNTFGDGLLNPIQPSNLNLCINRELIKKELKPGDHGALILAYRTSQGQTAAIPSFVVPVYLTVPHHTLAGRTGYTIQDEVKSFEVKRNYVSIPQGTSFVRVSLEVPSAKLQGCAGVELMALLGTNMLKPFKTREEAQVSNCDPSGRPFLDDSKRKLVFTQTDPLHEIWDLAVFGSYRYPKSLYKMRVDYFNVTTSVSSILGAFDALNGSFDINILDSSFGLQPDLAKSSYELNGLVAKSEHKIKSGDSLYVSNPMGKGRTYPADAKRVEIRTVNSHRNMIKLVVFECEPETTEVNENSDCNLVEQTFGLTQEESLSFEPIPHLVYFVRVDAIDVKEEELFTLKETLFFENEKGNLVFTGNDPHYHIHYSINPQQMQESPLINQEYFQSGKYKLKGAIVIKSADETSLSVIPIEVSNLRKKSNSIKQAGKANSEIADSRSVRSGRGL